MFSFLLDKYIKIVADSFSCWSIWLLVSIRMWNLWILHLPSPNCSCSLTGYQSKTLIIKENRHLVATSSSAVKNTDMCKETVQNPFLYVKGASQVGVCEHTLRHPSTHTLCTALFYTQTDVGSQGIDGKQVALKCYEIFRWHTRSNIYSIYNIWD